MLFNSSIFIFLFLPISLLVYYSLAPLKKTWGLAWLALASLFFYGWWNPKYLYLIIASMVFNLLLGKAILKTSKIKGFLVSIGIVGNLMALGFYKYAGFFSECAGWAFDSHFVIIQVILPLAISFYTFQQISFLMDVYRGNIRTVNPLAYCLFVTFFPQLIAGPIVHYQEMMPQFLKEEKKRFPIEDFNQGITLFTVGLIKKIVLADSIAVYANNVFNSSLTSHTTLSFFEAWGGALAYTLQLYFDFSGYADMAVGVGLMFGIRLPINFNSPYKAQNIIDFWRRWHITLGRFLKDYLYVPLGGNRHGKLRKNLSLFLTMLLGGLWHGAGITFVIWGIMHGLYLLINHTWRDVIAHHLSFLLQSKIYQLFCYGLTLIAVIFAWVMFRAESLTSALAIMHSMLDPFNAVFPLRLEPLLTFLGLEQAKYFSESGVGVFGDLWGMVWISVGLLFALVLPNSTQYILNGNLRTLGGWKPNTTYAFLTALGLFVAAKIIIHAPKSEFLYFNF